jgi:hypothetical protein
VSKVYPPGPICRRWIMWAALALACADPSLAQSADAVACAAADLALMQKLEVTSPSNTVPTRLGEAVQRMLQARSACLQGEYSKGLELYREADLLADCRGSSESTTR